MNAVRKRERKKEQEKENWEICLDMENQMLKLIQFGTLARAWFLICKH